MDQIRIFINDPLVAPIYALVVLALLDFGLGVYRSIQAGVFDWKKLPQILDSAVLQKIIPLAALGVASFMVTDGAAKSALTVAYVGACATALAGEVAAAIEKVRGGYKPTNTVMDRMLR